MPTTRTPAARTIDEIRTDLLGAYALPTDEPSGGAREHRARVVTGLLREMVDAALRLLAEIGITSPLTVYRDGLMAGIMAPAEATTVGLPLEIREDLLDECQRRRGEEIAAELRARHQALTAPNR